MVRRRVSTGGWPLALGDELGSLLGFVRQTGEGTFMDSPPWWVVGLGGDALGPAAVPAQLGIFTPAFGLGVSSGIGIHALVPFR